MTLEPTSYHHKLVYDEAGLIVSERLTLSPRFPVNLKDYDTREGLSRETEPLVPLTKALDYAAALVAAERERCAKLCEEISPENLWQRIFSCGEKAIRDTYEARAKDAAAAIREGGEHG